MHFQSQVALDIYQTALGPVKEYGFSILVFGVLEFPSIRAVHFVLHGILARGRAVARRCWIIRGKVYGLYDKVVDVLMSALRTIVRQSCYSRYVRHEG